MQGWLARVFSRLPAARMRKRLSGGCCYRQLLQTYHSLEHLDITREPQWGPLVTYKPMSSCRPQASSNMSRIRENMSGQSGHTTRPCRSLLRTSACRTTAAPRALDLRERERPR